MIKSMNMDYLKAYLMKAGNISFAQYDSKNGCGCQEVKIIENYSGRTGICFL